MIDELCARHAALAQGDAAPGEITVVFDAGQNSVANFAHLDRSGLHFVGSIPPSNCADLLKRPARARTLVDEPRFGGLTALETRRTVYGRKRRVVLTHSPTLHAAQSRGFDQSLAKAGTRLGDLADTLARGRTRRAREKVQAAVSAITKDPWVARVTTTELTGDTPKDLRLAWHIDARARRNLENEVFGKRVLVTDHDHWAIADVVAGYRSQSDAEFSFRQLKDPHVVSFGPMHHWTDHNIRIHVFTCVLALTVAHLMRRQAARADEPMSVRELLGHLAGIQETVLIYPSTGGRPKARRMLTDLTTIQARLARLFDLDPSAPGT
jgi:transposase